MDDWAEILRREAGSYARVALANIKREFPSGIYHTMKAPGDFPYRPRARTPMGARVRIKLPMRSRRSTPRSSSVPCCRRFAARR